MAQVMGLLLPTQETQTEFPAPSFNPHPAPVTTGIWGVNQQMGMSSICLCVCVCVHKFFEKIQKKKFIFGTKTLKLMHSFFFIIYISHELSEDPFIYTLFISLCILISLKMLSGSKTFWLFPFPSKKHNFQVVR